MTCEKPWKSEFRKADFTIIINVHCWNFTTWEKLMCNNQLLIRYKPNYALKLGIYKRPFKRYVTLRGVGV